MSPVNRFPSNFDRKWASYALAGSAAFLLPSTGYASTVFVPVNIALHSTDTPLAHNWDVDGDGTDDFQLTAAGSPHGERYTGIQPLGTNAVLGGTVIFSTGPFAHNLGVASIIDPVSAGWQVESQNFLADKLQQNDLVKVKGTWPNATDLYGYAGLRFSISGQTHYGWALVSTQLGSASLNVTQAAYESDPNTAITIQEASEVPEPSSMALMLLGAAGIFALKQRRHARGN